jgi:putative ABC transport system permease protein
MFLEYGLLRDDHKRIVSNLPAAVLERAVPMREIRKEIRFDQRSIECRLVGCTPDYPILNHLTIDRGRFLSSPDGEPPQNVCVLGAETAEALFPYENPIDRAVQIDKDFYRVVGTTRKRDPTAAIGGSLNSQDYNKDIYIPLQTLRVRIGDMVMTSRSGSREGELVQLSQITLGLTNLEDVEEVSEIIENMLGKYHPNKDFAVVVPKELLRQAELLRLMFNLLLVLIAGISLIVGGIGIMNIMLATVTERTREIGVRRALGARRADIIQQFVVEAVVLTGVGGSLGVGLGFLCGPTVHFIQDSFRELFPAMAATLPPTILQLEPRISPWSIFASLGISVIVGIVFGIYPALRDAYMDPIEALRHE